MSRIKTLINKIGQLLNEAVDKPFINLFEFLKDPAYQSSMVNHSDKYAKEIEIFLNYSNSMLSSLQSSVVAVANYFNDILIEYHEYRLLAIITCSCITALYLVYIAVGHSKLAKNESNVFFNLISPKRGPKTSFNNFEPKKDSSPQTKETFELNKFISYLAFKGFELNRWKKGHTTTCILKIDRKGQLTLQSISSILHVPVTTRMALSDLCAAFMCDREEGRFLLDVKGKVYNLSTSHVKACYIVEGIHNLHNKYAESTNDYRGYVANVISSVPVGASFPSPTKKNYRSAFSESQ